MAYKLQKDYTTDFGNSYNGAAQVATISFRTGPEQISWIDSWLKNNIVSEAVTAVKNQGGNVIRVQLFRDKSPTWYTKWQLLITAQSPADMSQARMAFPWAVWAAVVAAVLVVGWATNKVLESVEDVIWGSEGSSSLLGIPWLGWVALAGIVAYAVLSPKRKEKS